LIVDRFVGWVEECWRSLFVRRKPNSLICWVSIL
jgi:hypothetical protein